MIEKYHVYLEWIELQQGFLLFYCISYESLNIKALNGSSVLCNDKNPASSHWTQLKKIATIVVKGNQKQAAEVAGNGFLRFEPVRCTVSHPTLQQGREEGDVGFNMSSSSEYYGCAIFCGQTLFCTGKRLSGGKFNYLFIARVPYLQLKIALYYNAIFS